MNNIYHRQVALLIKIMPSVFRIKDFAVHGGTAINLFHKNMPRYSVDIDLTYIPIQDRKTSLDTINEHLVELKIMIERSIPGIHIVHKPDVWKLQNINKLRNTNTKKFEESISKLTDYFGLKMY
jgi:predicted nucleotidyltransferase component of viral defense system